MSSTEDGATIVNCVNYNHISGGGMRLTEITECEAKKKGGTNK
jgi:hypothetical protein